MEKGIEVIMRYHCRDGYFVEVTHEKSALAGRDYWLCRRGSAEKVFLFSSAYQGSEREERQILRHLDAGIRKYERAAQEELPA